MTDLYGLMTEKLRKYGGVIHLRYGDHTAVRVEYPYMQSPEYSEIHCHDGAIWYSSKIGEKICTAVMPFGDITHIVYNGGRE